jgi:CheY-like chemotaxis protein
MDHGSLEALAGWLAETVNRRGSLTTQEAITLMRGQGATELSALLALAQALESGRVRRDPRALERIRAAQDEPAPSASRPTQEVRPCVMVVEDDAAVRDSVSEALETEGYRVYAAADGAEALRVLGQVPTPSLILLDLMMPVMDGWELLRRLKQDQRLSAVPVAIVSGTNDNRPREMKFIRKPINLVTLIETVEELRASPQRRSA